METELLYLNDSYMRESDALVTSVKDGKYVVLDKTIFYPNSGGQPHDEGFMTTKDGVSFKVIFVGKFSGNVSHEIEPIEGKAFSPDQEVHCTLDWGKRYKLMRSHTAAHVVSGIIAKELGAQIHGNQKSLEKIRIDFNTENFDKEYLKELVEKSNRIIEQNLSVKTYFTGKDELEKNPDLMKLAKGLPEDVKEVRIVDIDGFDKQPCGGTHVNNLSEVGKLEFIKAENRGKNNRRLYFKLVED